MPATDLVVVCGRRGGKTRFAAGVVAYAATCIDWTPVLAPGEVATIMLLAPTREQSSLALRYIKGILALPVFANVVEREQAERLELRRRVNIEVHASSYRSIRGRSVVLAVLESAFFRSEDSALPDVALYNALVPSMATVPGALRLILSSPYSQRGLLYHLHRDHFGAEDSPVLVAQGATRDFNPEVPQRIIDTALADDPQAARSEWLGQFRLDVQGYVHPEALDAVIVPGRHEIPPVVGTRYVAFCDPSGGSRDAMTLAIAHVDDRGIGVLDAIRERRPPFDPDAVVREFTATARSYGCSEVTGDRYGGAWVAQAFEKLGLRYTPAQKPKSDLYYELLPAINSGRIELLDHTHLRVQLLGLERRTARGGRDSIDHARGSHDDTANAVAGALVEVLVRGRGDDLGITLGDWDGRRSSL